MMKSKHVIYFATLLVAFTFLTSCKTKEIVYYGADDMVYPRYKPPLSDVRAELVSLKLEGDTTEYGFRDMPEFSEECMIPRYEKGWDGFLREIEALRFSLVRNDEYPRGTVKIRFIVNKKGKIVAPQILRGISYGTDKSVIDIFQRSTFQLWIPAIRNHEFIDSEIIVNIIFIEGER